MTPLEMGVIEFCTVRAFVLWHVLQEETFPVSIIVYPPPSGRHAMRSLYGIGRDSWVWEMSKPALASMHSCHGERIYSVSVVWPLAGVYSGRPLNENYCR